MARRKPLPLSWSPVPGATSYRVRIVPADHPNDDTVYNAPYDEIDALPDSRHSVDLYTLSRVPTVSGTYDIYVSAYNDDLGEGDLALLDNAKLDFTVLPAPKDLKLG